ncbi:MAG TPA: helix-turn-helix domain-containing protein [Kineosporiaceae bacterium]|nr:helix-turn-helix domain-containing protein [Kineosporiaceae bacterium]
MSVSGRAERLAELGALDHGQSLQDQGASSAEHPTQTTPLNQPEHDSAVDENDSAVDENDSAVDENDSAVDEGEVDEGDSALDEGDSAVDEGEVDESDSAVDEGEVDESDSALDEDEVDGRDRTLQDWGAIGAETVGADTGAGRAPVQAARWFSQAFPGHSRPTGRVADSEARVRALASAAATLAAADPGQAGVLLDRAETAALGVVDPAGRARALAVVAAAMQSSDPDRAEALTDQAADLAETLPDGPAKAQALAEVAVAVADGDPDEGARLAELAWQIGADLTDPAARASTLTQLARTVHGVDPGLAADALAEAERALTGVGDGLVRAGLRTAISAARALTDPAPVPHPLSPAIPTRPTDQIRPTPAGPGPAGPDPVGSGAVRDGDGFVDAGARGVPRPTPVAAVVAGDSGTGPSVGARASSSSGGTGVRRSWGSGRATGWEVVGAAARAVAVTDPDQAEKVALSVHDVAGRSWVLTEVALVVAATSVDRAVEVIGKIPGELARVNALELLGDAVAAAEPERATRLYAEADRLARTHLRAVAAVDPGSAAGLARGVPDPTARAWALVEVAAAVGTRDGLLGQQLVSEAQTIEGVGRDPVSQMAQAAAGDPGYAERIARTVSDRTARAWALTSVAKVLLETDPARAVRLLTDAADLQARAVLVGDIHLRSHWRSAREKAYQKVSAWAVGPAPADAAATMFAGADDTDPDATRAGRSGRAVHPRPAGVFWQYKTKPRPAPDTTGTTKIDPRPLRSTSVIRARRPAPVAARPGAGLTVQEQQLQREIDELERQRQQAQTAEEQHRTHTLGSQPPTDQESRTPHEHDHEQRAQAWFEHHLTRTPKPCLFSRLLTALVPGKPTPHWKDDTVQDWGAIGDDDTDTAPSSADDYQPPTTRTRTQPPATDYATAAPGTRYPTAGQDAPYSTGGQAPQYATPAGPSGGTGVGGWTGPGPRSTRTRSVRFADQVPSTPAQSAAADLAQSLYDEGVNGPQTDPAWGPASPGEWSGRDGTSAGGNAVDGGGVVPASGSRPTASRRSGKAPVTSDGGSPEGFLSQDPASSDSPSLIGRFSGTGTWVGRLHATAGASTLTGHRASGSRLGTRTTSVRRQSTVPRVSGTASGAVAAQPQPAEAAEPASRIWWAPGATAQYLTDPARLRTLLTERNMTMEGLARAVDTHRPVISQLLSGVVPYTSSQNARRICRTLGVPQETLFSDEGPQGVAVRDRTTSRTGIGPKTAVLTDRALLRTLVEASGLTQDELARRAGVSGHATLGALLSGRLRSVKRQTAVGFAEALGTHVSKLFIADEPWVDRPTGLRPAPSSEEGPTFEPDTYVTLTDPGLLRTLMQDRVSCSELGKASGLTSNKIEKLRSGVLPRVNSGSAEAMAQYLDVHPLEMFRGPAASASTRQAAIAEAASRSQPVSRPQVTVISSEFLNDVRRAAKVSRDDLARSAGWEHAEAVSQLLDGHRTTLDAVAAERISQHLGTPVGTFFTLPGPSSAAGPSGSGASMVAGAAAGPGSSPIAHRTRSRASTASGASAGRGSSSGAGPSRFGAGTGVDADAAPV